MPTPNKGIPYLPEGTLDLSAGVNAGWNVVDTLDAAVIAMDLTAPPGAPDDGALYIVAAPASGDWVLQENNLARYVDEGAFWQFYVAGVHLFEVFNRADGQKYFWDETGSPGAWAPAGGGGGGVVLSVVAGAGIAVDNTDPANPIVSAAGGGAPLFDQSEAAVPGATETDYNPGTWAGGASKTRIVLTPTADSVLNSLDASGMADGESVLLVNDASAFTVTFTHEHGGSTAANRFRCPAGVDFGLLPYQSIVLTRCSSRWRPL